jgi:hypothetical protein
MRRFAPREATGHRPQATEEGIADGAQGIGAESKRYWGTAVAEAAPAPAAARAPEPEPDELCDGVTPSDDWGADEDPESYSAPV